MNEFEVTGLETYQEDAAGFLPTILYELLGDAYKKCSKQNITDYLAIIARQNEYNPVLDLIAAEPWNGTDQFPSIYKALHIPEGDILSRTLIKKWFMQGAALLQNNSVDPFGADGALVLIGGQGKGKTTFFERAAMTGRHLPRKYFRDGQTINDKDKDTKRRCITTWICELGEIDTTFKNDIPALKAFISSPYDEYRLPYGRTDKKAPRRTSICGTTNDTADDAGYLVDITGNRRFWTVHVRSIELDAVNAIDFLQVWRQAYHLVKGNLQSFRLTKEEQQMLETRNAGHMKPSKGTKEVDDILFAALNNPNDYQWEYQTVTAWKMKFDALKNLDSVVIGRAITAAIKNNPEYATDERLHEKNARQEGKPVKVKCLPSFKPNQPVPWDNER
jgi:predicted P-loop ATPase